ncbi:MAG: bifunctional (p)ppGpp synthetase/guanosine-3',5'-bis(diphosphate) 3'-pyrophosphohydrolase, partial [Saprospiraceae bacterium]|nr:bifunctional (p)ppGpp synthetase/guanosine-3',5'-bis(diphosphate) 3'-pyrophosphohydrolase [Saprospiraceae bacterium]
AISLDQVKIDLKKFKTDGGKLSEIKEVRKVKTDEVSDELGNTSYAIDPTKNKSLLLINGENADKFSFQFASCCHPLPGDDIFAFVTTANTLKIHRTSCPNSEHLLASYGYRVLKADWTNVATSSFVEELVITGTDNGPGIIQSITENINKFGLNIRSFKIDGNEGIFEGVVKLEIHNLDQMNALIRTLKNLPYISNVKRSN